ncbi:MAG: hypothetical protein EI684_15785 [Candidatus Viridilinea halotolerans]|uniref:YcxB family protein n=1 Tax=Candidatus Viridilinea halotolerans TaxID=2491704 RepID=A0A426TVB4_9CHLR|nr:MAG: hypothetical protein EI684_15785 [Candidatus Viridilinea halotolerans]
MNPQRDQEVSFAWTARLLFWRSRVLMLTVGVALLMPVLAIGLLIIVLDWPPNRDSMLMALFFMGVALGLFALGGLLMGFLYQGGHTYHYMVDSKGLRSIGVGRSAALDRIVVPHLNRGPHAGTPASTSPSEYVTWGEVDNLSVDAKARIITLKRGWLPRMVIACDEANYAAVLAFIEQRMAAGRSGR